MIKENETNFDYVAPPDGKIYHKTKSNISNLYSFLFVFLWWKGSKNQTVNWGTNLVENCVDKYIISTDLFLFLLLLNPLNLVQFLDRNDL